MLDNRLLYELHLLHSFKINHEYLTDFFIESDDPLSIRFSLYVKEHSYDFLAVFYKYFPKQPIVIKKMTSFKSGHCYKNGTMCLKWGQDNWDDDLHFIDLIENLYELLYDENPLGDEHGIAENGDIFTFGQEIRMSNSDLLIVPYNILNICKKSGIIECTESTNKGNKVFVITRIDDNIIFNNIFSTTICFNYLIADLALTEIKTLGLDGLINTLKLNNSTNHIVFSSDNKVFVFLKDNEIFKEVDYIVNHDEMFKRSGINDEVLDKKISIIGLGSVGSRVLCDLARAGFRNFYIVDDDFFLPYNTLRHELTDRYIGMFKVDALKQYITDEINNEANIDVSKLAPNGQESSFSTNKFLESLEGSSIVIDCTACDAVFYTIDAFLNKNKAPFISGTIIPGGLGNIIFYRKKDSVIDLESILTSFWQWSNKHLIFGEKSNDYSATIDGQTHIATMSDCSILSGLIGRLCIDILEGKNVELEEINVFSTSNYEDLKQYYLKYSVSASQKEKTNEVYKSEDLLDGLKIYEDYCSKNSGK